MVFHKTTAGIQQLYGRATLRLQISILFTVATLLFSLLLSLLIGQWTRLQFETQAGERMFDLAYQMADKLDRGMFERYRDIQIVSTLADIRNPLTSPEERRAIFDRMQTSYPDYAWIGFLDTQGNVIAATGSIFEGQNGAERPIFQNGLIKASVGDVHDAVRLANLLPNPTGETLRFVDISTPVYDRQQKLIGVLAAHLSWQWANEVRDSLLQPTSDEQQVDIFIVNSDGNVLLGPGLIYSPISLGNGMHISLPENGFHLMQWEDGTSYLTGVYRTNGYRDYPGLGWTVITRQLPKTAFQHAEQLQVQILILGLVFGVLFTGLGWIAAERIARPMLKLARDAAETERSARRKAEESDQLKLKFLAMISHELRTPLTSIKGFATTLLAKDVSWSAEAQHEFIGVIAEESNKLQHLVEQLLDVSRIQAGTFSVHPKMQSLQNALDIAQAQLGVLTSQHQLHVTLPHDLPPAYIDEQRIAQVLVNLVSNAVKHSPPHTAIYLKAERVNDAVCVSVMDEGSGIPPEARGYVFEVFRQVEHRGDGAGLGLAICKAVIEGHGGCIWIDERPAKGTKISFTLLTTAPAFVANGRLPLPEIAHLH